MDAPRVIVVGAGPAGVRATEALVRLGLRPVVVDEAPAAGGQIYRRQPPGFTRASRDLYGFEAAKAEAVHRTFDGLASRIDYRPRTLAWNAQDGVLYTNQDGTIAKIPFDAMILATGATDRMFPVPGWTKPGVYTLGGSQVALKHQACAVGDPVVFAGSSPLLYLVAYQYAKAGARVAAVLDSTPFARKRAAAGGMLAAPSVLAKGLYYMAALKARGIALRHGVTLLEIEGTDHVEGLRYRDADGSERRIACTAVAYGYGIKPEAQLAEIAGGGFRFDAAFRQWFPDCDADGRLKDGLYVVGDGARVGGADAAEASGELAALALARDFKLATDEGRMSGLRRRVETLVRFQKAQASAFRAPVEATAALADDAVVCRCEVITAGEIRRVVRQDLGAREMNRVKAFCRVGMGRCQGRFCGHAAAEIVADALKVELESVGRLRAAGPVKPLPFGAAATEET